jgi:hypothetical protein
MKKMILIALLILSLPLVSKAVEEFNPFLTDFCTAYPEGTSSQPNKWKHCCIEHDLYFWAGGNKEDRNEADNGLKNCVEKTGAKLQARLIYFGVSLGGRSPIKFKTKQWGNAWSQRKRYLSLDEIETSSIIHFLDLNNTELSTELKQSFKQKLYSRLDKK